MHQKFLPICNTLLSEEIVGELLIANVCVVVVLFEVPLCFAKVITARPTILV